MVEGFTDSEGNFSLSFHAPASSGSYAVVAVANDSSVEGRSSEIALEVLAIEGIDLLVSASDIRFSTIRHVQHVLETIYVDIRNSGSTPLEVPVLVRFFDEKVLIAERTIPALPAGSVHTVSLDYSFPAWGGRRLSVSVDPLNTVAEFSEANNIAEVSLLVKPSAEDITPQDIILSPAVPIAGASVEIQAVILNLGAKDVQGMEIVFFVGGSEVAKKFVDIPAFGKVITPGFTHTFPNAVDSVRIKVQADPQNQFLEASEANNTYFEDVRVLPETIIISVTGGGGGSGGSVILVDTRPNLIPMKMLFSDEKPYHGQEIDIHVEIWNSGLSAAENFKVVFFHDNTPLGNPHVLDSLLAKETIVIHQPYAAVAGTHTLKIVLDSENLVSEIGENDNQLERILFVYPKPMAQLRVTSKDVHFLDASGLDLTEIHAGQQVILSAAVENTVEADLPAKNVPVSFYADYDLLGIVDIPAIAVGAVSTATIKYDIPMGTPYKIVRVIVDEANVIAEYNLQDNAASRLMVISTVPMVSPLIGLSGSVLGTSSIAWSWNSSGESVLYHVFSSSAGTLLAVVDQTIFIQADLSSNTAYGIWVEPFTDAGSGALSPSATTFTLALDTRPNLIPMKMLFSDEKPYHGQEIDIHVEIWNSGLSAAENFKVVFFHDNTPLGDPHVLDSLMAGATIVIHQPYAAVAGTHILKIVLDPENLVSEVGENDNQLERILLVYPEPLAQLRVRSEDVHFLDASGLELTEINPGQQVILAAAVENTEEADLPAKNVPVSFYADHDLLGIVDVPAIAVGAVSVATIEYHIPMETSNKIVRVIVDEANVIAEYNLQDNAASRLMVISTVPMASPTVESPMSGGVTLSGDTAWVKLKTPGNGRKIRGNAVTILVEAGEEVRAVLFQYKPAEENEWRDISLQDKRTPFAVYWNVSALETGDYDIRAVGYHSDGVPDPTPEVVRVAVVDINADIVEDGNPSVDPNRPHRKEERLPSGEDRTVWIADGTRLSFYAGALDGSTVTVTIVNNPFAAPPVPNNTAASGVVAEIALSNGQSQLLSGKKAALTLRYPDDDDDGIVDGTTIRAEQLQMYSSESPTGPWKKDLVSRVNLADKTVTGNTSHFSFFALFAPLAAKLNLDLARVYPVPFMPNSGDPDDGVPLSLGNADSGIIFDNLTASVSIKIYTVTGQRVAKFGSDNSGGRLQWDVKNLSGQNVASGGYLAVISSPGNATVVKKLLIVR